MKKKILVLFLVSILVLSACSVHATINEGTKGQIKGIIKKPDPESIINIPEPGEGNVITFNDDRIMLINGEPFFPIGRWWYGRDPWNSVNDYYKLPSWLEGYDGDKMFFFGEQLYRDLWLNYKSTGYFDMDLFESALEGINHSNFLGWYALDEPVWRYENFHYPYAGPYWFIQLIYDKLKQYDPDHPVWMNFCAADISDDVGTWIEKRRMYAQAADVVSADVYPKWMNPGPGDDQCCSCGPRGCGLGCVLDNCEISVVGDYVDLLLQEVVEYEKPVWFVPQAWGAVNQHEIRFMTYQAIIHGATGIFYWYSAAPGYEMVLPDAQNVADELIELQPVLVAETIDAPVTQAHGIETLVKELENEYYILSVNRESLPTRTAVLFDLTSIGIFCDGHAYLVEQLPVPGMPGKIEIDDGKLQLQFDGFDTKILRIPKQACPSGPNEPNPPPEPPTQRITIQKILSALPRLRNLF